MKRVALTGATGFIGRRVLGFLQALGGVETVCLGRNEEKLCSLGSPYVVHDIGHGQSGLFDKLGAPDMLIHLAWEGLPNYDGPFHVAKNLPDNIAFLKGLIDEGLAGLTVTGTCFEYGRRDGCLAETHPTNPNTHYALAKDALRRFLEMYCQAKPFRFLWARLFYVFGEGQGPGSLLPLVDRALEAGAESFDMTLGEQLRDYLPVDVMAERIGKIALQERVVGVINVCSGRPVSIRRLVENHLKARGVDMHLNLGAVPYSNREPLAFWGDVSRQNQAIQSYHEDFRSSDRM